METIEPDKVDLRTYFEIFEVDLGFEVVNVSCFFLRKNRASFDPFDQIILLLRWQYTYLLLKESAHQPLFTSFTMLKHGPELQVSWINAERHPGPYVGNIIS